MGHNYVWGAHWLLHQCPRTAWSWWPPRHQDYSVCPHNLRHHHRCPAQPHGRLRGRYSHGVAGMAEQGHSRRTAVSSATLRRVTNRPLAPSSPLRREYRDRSRRAAASVTELLRQCGSSPRGAGRPQGRQTVVGRDVARGSSWIDHCAHAQGHSSDIMRPQS